MADLPEKFLSNNLLQSGRNINCSGDGIGDGRKKICKNTEISGFLAGNEHRQKENE